MTEPTLIQPRMDIHLDGEHTRIEPLVKPNLGSSHLANGTFIDEFEIIEVIGQGGFGVVYRALDRNLQREVAIKEFFPVGMAIRDPSGHIHVAHTDHQETFDLALCSFVNEARLLAGLNHPNLIKVYRFWESRGTAWMVTPFYRGKTLLEVSKSTELLSETQITRWLEDVALALAELHSQDILHRDVSPENVMILEGDSSALLLDFGAARKALQDASREMTVILKASYSPPEQYSSHAGWPQGPWTDIYALGGVAHFLLAGRPPASAASRLVKDSYHALRDANHVAYSLNLKGLIDDCLILNPAQRLRNVESFLMRLRKHTGTDNSSGLLNRVRSKVGVFTVVFAMATMCAASLWAFLGGEPPATDSAATQGPVSNSLPNPIFVEGSVQTAAQSDWTTELLGFSAHTSGVVHARALKSTLIIDEDNLVIQVNSKQSGYLAVFAETSEGQLTKLIPTKLQASIAIQAGKTIELPQDDTLIQASGPAGKDKILVLFSESPFRWQTGDFTVDDFYPQWAGTALGASKARAIVGINHCAEECVVPYSAQLIEVTQKRKNPEP